MQDIEITWHNRRNAKGYIADLEHHVHPTGIINITFNTPEHKYVDIGNIGYTVVPSAVTEDLKVIPITDYSEEYDDNGLTKWYAEIQIKGTEGAYELVILPLKHQYVLSLVPLSLVLWEDKGED